MTMTLESILGDDLKCYLNADDLSGDGSDVTSWIDRVNGIDFAEATNPPTFNANQDASGYPAVEFDGTELLCATDAAIDLTDGFILLFACARRATTNLLTPVSCFNSSTDYVRLRQASGGWYFQDVGGFLGARAITTPTSQRQVISYRYQSDRAVGAWLEDDGEYAGRTYEVTATGTPVHSDTWYLGERGDGVHKWIGAIHAMAICSLGCDMRTIMKACTQLRYDFGLNDADSEPEPPVGSGGHPTSRVVN